MNQYGQQQQQQPNWGSANTMPGGPPGSPMPVHGGKGGPPPSGPPSGGPRPPGPSHTTPHYMKQHLQHHLQQQQQQKMYGMASSPGPGPGPGPAPAAAAGQQGPPPPSSLPQSQPPPTQQQQQHMGPYPPAGMNNASSMTGSVVWKPSHLVRHILMHHCFVSTIQVIRRRQLLPLPIW